MRGRRFNGTSPKIEATDQAVYNLNQCWRDYVACRKTYADALVYHGRAKHGFDVDQMATANEFVDDSRTRYFEAIDALRTAHFAYKTAFRDLLIGKLL